MRNSGRKPTAKLDVLLKISPVVISLLALTVSVASYLLASETNKRSAEQLLFARKGYPHVADIQMNSQGRPAYVKDYEILISNASIIPITLTHCSIEYDSPGNAFAGGVGGETCQGNFRKGEVGLGPLPILLSAGETVQYEFREEWELQSEQVSSLSASRNIGEFHIEDCSSEAGIKMRLFIEPSDSCLPYELRNMAGELWLEFTTGRGTNFRTRDIRWWLG